VDPAALRRQQAGAQLVATVPGSDKASVHAASGVEGFGGLSADAIAKRLNAGGVIDVSGDK